MGEYALSAQWRASNAAQGGIFRSLCGVLPSLRVEHAVLPRDQVGALSVTRARRLRVRLAPDPEIFNGTRPVCAPGALRKGKGQRLSPLAHELLRSFISTA